MVLSTLNDGLAHFRDVAGGGVKSVDSTAKISRKNPENWQKNILFFLYYLLNVFYAFYRNI